MRMRRSRREPLIASMGKTSPVPLTPEAPQVANPIARSLRVTPSKAVVSGGAHGRPWSADRVASRGPAVADELD